MTFCPTLALRRIITRKLSQIKIPHKRHLFKEIVQGESETIDKLAVRLGKKPSNVKNVITEIKWRPEFEIISSQTVGLKSCDVKFLEKFQTLSFKLWKNWHGIMKWARGKHKEYVYPLGQSIESLTACPGGTVEIPVHRQVVSVTDVEERFILLKMSDQYPARGNMHKVFSS